MIPAQNITASGNVVPWVDRRQVEQDPIVSRALVEIFVDDMLHEALQCRGGTALNQLTSASRYDTRRTSTSSVPPPTRFSQSLDRLPLGAL